MYPGHGRDIEEICGYRIPIVEKLLVRIRYNIQVRNLLIDPNDLHMMGKILEDLLESVGVTTGLS